MQRLALLEVRIEQEQGDAPSIPLGSASDEATVSTPLIARMSPNKPAGRGPRSPLQKFASAGAGLVRTLTRRSLDSPRGLDRALSAVPDAGTASRLDLSGLTQRSLYWSQETGHVIAEREKLRYGTAPPDCHPLLCDCFSPLPFSVSFAFYPLPSPSRSCAYSSSPSSSFLF